MPLVRHCAAREAPSLRERHALLTLGGVCVCVCVGVLIAVPLLSARILPANERKSGELCSTLAGEAGPLAAAVGLSVELIPVWPCCAVVIFFFGWRTCSVPGCWLVQGGPADTWRAHHFGTRVGVLPTECAYLPV